jgi:hypothetical protein
LSMVDSPSEQSCLDDAPVVIRRRRRDHAGRILDCQCAASAVCAIFKHSAANRRYSSDRDIESSPPFGTIGGNAERVYGVPYGLAGSGPFLRAMVHSLTSAAALLGATRFEWTG